MQAGDGGLYYLAYAVGPNAAFAFYPSLAMSDAGFASSSWTLVGQDDAAVPYEGSRMVYLSGQYWALWSSTSDSNVYNLAMQYQGKYANLPVDAGYAAHPMLVPVGAYVYQVTFDDEQYQGTSNALGHMRVFRSRRDTAP
jgi:hypothetical protein